MKKLNFFDIKPGELHKPIITMGVFDGVHRGHQSLLKKVQQYAAERQGTSVVVTFVEHPAAITKKIQPLTITSLSERLRLLENFQVNTCVLIDFNQNVASISAEKFIEEYLCQKLCIEGIVIGENFRFGYGGQGDPLLLKKFGQLYNFFVDVQQPVMQKNDWISSSRVRKAITEGDCNAAFNMLGRYFSVKGKVIDGKKIGRQLGFPTANLQLEHTLIPQDGIYMGFTKRENNIYLSLISVGNNPTFANKVKSVEVYLDKFSEMIYGETIETFLVQKIRGQIQFTNIDKLIEQMNQDLKVAREMFLQEVKDTKVISNYSF